MFLLELSRQKGKGFRHIAQAAGQVLRDYPWPGNIRELRNTIEWAVFRHNDTTLKVEHLQILPAAKTLTKPSTGPPPPLGEDKFTLPRGGLALGKLINNIVHRAYLLQRGNKSRTARYLGISRSSLYTHLRRLERAGYTLKID
ncbi:MAG: ArsR family transcriptional regulator [Firmicutes bacterium]|nr:ArsR family transcriptional regulator [Bacillota bacterium]